MTNPNGAVAGNSQNIPQANTPRTRSTFDLGYHFFNTHRFGEYCPHYVAELNKDEVFPVRSQSTLRTYTLKSPLLQNVKRSKDYFLVPMECILPLNWEKFFDNPVRGDDVLDDVGPTVHNFWSVVAGFTNQLANHIENTILADTNFSTYDPTTQFTACFRFLILLEYFYSSGNLLASLGCHGTNYFYDYDVKVRRDFDYYFDMIIDALVTAFNSYDNTGVTLVLSYPSSGEIYRFSFGDTNNSNKYISFRHALQLMRDDPTFVITNSSDNELQLGIQTIRPFLNDIYQRNYIITQGDVPCNLSRLWAYQLSCAHYFTNDHIDFVYSAELYRQLIGNYITTITTSNYYTNAFFTRNGVKYQYDYLSAHFFNVVISNGTASAVNILTTSNIPGFNSILGYFSALFGYRRSLKYLDYFTGSRAQPLAVVGTQSGINGGISTNVAVSGNLVSVIDITKSIQAQRFLNSVNRVRHSFEGYLKGIFGGSMPAPDYHNPFYVAHADDVIFGQETENTATQQMTDSIAITTNLRARSNDFVFEVHSDRPAILIGITSYDIPRVYSKSIERPFFHENRFDWFNPFMQYIGDQPIYANELGLNPSSISLISQLSVFSYTLRHMEYKQRFNQCAGGFCFNLPGWLFLAKDELGNIDHISPEWIRAFSAEFDRFYVSLTGWSLGSYFHFIVDDYNSCKASRPMAYAPQILA